MRLTVPPRWLNLPYCLSMWLLIPWYLCKLPINTPPKSEWYLIWTPRPYHIKIRHTWTLPRKRIHQPSFLFLRIYSSCPKVAVLLLGQEGLEGLGVWSVSMHPAKWHIPLVGNFITAVKWNDCSVFVPFATTKRTKMGLLYWNITLWKYERQFQAKSCFFAILFGRQCYAYTT